MTFETYVREDPEIIERFVSSAFTRNPRISDFREFKNALMSADRLDRASSMLGDTELKQLFESEECKTRIRQNITEEEFEDIYGEVATGRTFIVRRRPRGKPAKVREVRTYTIKRPMFAISSHTRAGKSVKSYNKSYGRWSPAQARFLQIRKRKGISTRNIVWEYNQYFRENPRTASSIRTKVYRV